MKLNVSFCFVLLIAITNGSAVNRIINGNPAGPAQFPFMASLRTLANVHFCGGFLFNNNNAGQGGNRWIITAAHCVRGRMPGEINARLGTNSLTEGGQVFAIDQMVTHPNYDPNLIDNNIALIRTAVVVSTTPSIAPIGINVEATDGGDPVLIPGWGLTSVGGINFGSAFVKCNSNFIYSGQEISQMICNLRV